MRKSLLIILTLLTVHSFGQSKKLIVPIHHNGDTTHWFESRKQLYKKVGLANLVTAKEKLRIRLSDDNKIVDIWTSDLVTFKGQQVMYTSSFDPNNSDNLGRLYSKKKPISADTSKMIFRKIESSGILKIPEQDSIKNWGNGFLDGYTYIIESSDLTTYTLKSYWTPSQFEALPEGRTLYTLEKEMDKLLKLTRHFKVFIDNLPADKCYRVGGISVRCPIKNGKSKKKS